MVSQVFTYDASLETDLRYMHFHDVDDGPFSSVLSSSDFMDQSDYCNMSYSTRPSCLSRRSFLSEQFDLFDTTSLESRAIWDQDEEQDLNGDIALLSDSGQSNQELSRFYTVPVSRDSNYMIHDDYHDFVASENNIDNADTSVPQRFLKSPTPEKQLGKINAETAQQNQIENNLSDSLCKNLTSPNNLTYDDAIRNRDIKQEFMQNEIKQKVKPLIHPGMFIKTEDCGINDPLHELHLDRTANKILLDEHLRKRELSDDNKPDVLNSSLPDLLNSSFDKLKNFDLINAVGKDEIDLDLSIDSDKLDDLHHDLGLDDFDLTSYINGDDPIESIINSVSIETAIPKSEPIVTAKPKSKPIVTVIPKADPISIKKNVVSPVKIDLVDTDDDCIDVETVSPASCRPVLEARDVTSLLEQFEANEAVNVSMIDDNHLSTKNAVKSKKLPEVRKSTISYSKRKALSIEESHSKRKALSVEDINEKTSKVMNRIKANVKRKPVPVIEPLPIAKTNNKIIDHSKKIMQKKVKTTKAPRVVNQPESTSTTESQPTELEIESYRNDHNYCPIGDSEQTVQKGVDNYEVLRGQKLHLGQGIGSKGIRFVDTTKNNPKIEDTAIRIADKPKSRKTSSKKTKSTATVTRASTSAATFSRAAVATATVTRAAAATPTITRASTSTTIPPPVPPQQKINSLLKPTTADNARMQNSTKSVLLKSNNTNSLLKSSNNNKIDGKIMISVLKTNQKMKNTVNPTPKVVVIETKIPQTQCIQQNIIDTTSPPRPKKRKLNLEEYKKRRQIDKTRSCDNSRTNSPIHITSGSSSPLVNYGSFSLPVTAVGSPAQSSTPSSEKEVKKLTHQEMLLKMAADLLTTTPMKSTGPKTYTIIPFTPPGVEVAPQPTRRPPIPPKPCNDNIEMLTTVSIGVNTDLSLINEIKPQPAPKIQFQIKKMHEINKINKLSPSQTTVSQQLVKQLNLGVDQKITKIMTPILQNVNSSKINRNSLISNITETILQKKRSAVNNSSTSSRSSEQQYRKSAATTSHVNRSEEFEHGEDKTVIVLDKNRVRPQTVSIEVQTDPIEFKHDLKDKNNSNHNKKSLSVEKVTTKRQYRARRESYSSTTSVETISPEISQSRQSHKPSSSHSAARSVSSIHSSSGSTSSRSYSRSDSRSSYSTASTSSYSSSRSSSRSSRSRGSYRSYRHYDSTSSRDSHNKYSRSRRRSRSNHSYRSYNRSRSPLNRLGNRKRRSNRDKMDPEKLLQIEERRIVYVGGLEPETTKNDLIRRFSKHGPIIETSIHSRKKGDNYGFVTFQYKADAFDAIEHGNDDKNLPQYDISFGGRRVFCQTGYADLDNGDEIEMNSYNRNRQETNFDILLEEALKAKAAIRDRNV